MSRSEQEDSELVGHYTVGWICALEEEYECACRMLDEEFSGPEVDHKDDNTYVYGRIANHKVIIGCLPAGRYGTNSAARVARDMVRSFPQLRFALLVGIGGGAPTKDHDIRLGDVVVSQPQDGFGGVLQYDLGKKLPNGGFQKTGQLNSPPEKLLGVIPEIRRLYNDKRKPDRIAEHIQCMDDQEEYQRPMIDRLYRTDYQHVDGKTCEQCDVNQIIQRPERRLHRVIAVHYGTIASGNSVLKDATIRDIYANDSELNILCFEMEAAGLMNNLPCLVIRGICDYCDSHKNDEWHKYAALTAAAYARELLLVLKSQRVQIIPSWGDFKQVRQDMTSIIDSQSELHNRLDIINQKIDSAKLPVVEGAAFDSYMNQHEDECLPGTRTEICDQITKWAMSPTGKSIFWLNGMAGTGKSTISRTVAKSLKQSNMLGASFFFKRGEGERGNAKKFFSTLIKQLMPRISGIWLGVQKALNYDPDIASKSLEEQFEKLLLQPLLNLNRLGRQRQITVIVIVIDALDECENDKDVRRIILLLPRLQKVEAVHFRIFMTSRPELPIRLGFSEITDYNYQDLVLHEIPEKVTEHDIKLFLQYRFAKIKKGRNISHDWPGENVIQTLTTVSVPLFISAATVCRYIENSKWEPKLCLQELLRDQARYISKMDKTYLPILKRLVDDQKNDKWEQQQLLREFQTIIGAIILLAVPLSINALSLFLGIEADHINSRLDSFRSVLSVPDCRDQPVRILHLSFRDFLVQPGTKFSVDRVQKHKDITKLCLNTMQYHLQKNICHLGSPGTRRADINPQIIHQYLPPELQYSCRYWIYHLEKNQASPSEIEEVQLFLQKHFLYWLEAMALLGLISEVISMLDLLHKIIPGDKNSVLSDFVHDGKRFILKNHQIADEAPLQIYYAGLVFAPQSTLIRTEFKTDFPSWIFQLPQVTERWSAELQTLEGHSDWVLSVAFSPDGRLLVSGSDDKTVRLWDPATGGLHQTFEGHSGGVLSVNFSPDGRLLASGSYDCTVRLWDLATGGLHQTLEGHSGGVSSVAFSPDGRLLASSSDDKTVRFWDPATGGLHQTLEGHYGRVFSVAFSPDGRLLASGSSDKTVRIWDLATGGLHRNLEGHSDLVHSVMFSPDGRLLASVSYDNTVRLWDLATSGLQQTLEGHSDWVLSVAFSPDGRLLVSGSNDKTVRLWDLATGGLQQTLEGHSDGVSSVTFSPDGRLLASVSYDNTVRIWDPATGGLHQTPEGHSDSVLSVAFSPDGRLLASGSYDCTVRLWDLATGDLHQTLEGHSGGVLSVAFSPDGRLLASGSYDCTVRIWDLTTGGLQQTLEGHSSWVSSVAFSPNGQLLASGSYDYTVRIWDPATGGLQLTLVTEGVATELEFSQDNSYISINLGLTRMQFSVGNNISNSPKMNKEVYLEKDWVVLNGKQVLWLPHEFRPSCLAIKSNILALGHRSGRVSFIGFRV